MVINFNRKSLFAVTGLVIALTITATAFGLTAITLDARKEIGKSLKTVIASSDKAIRNWVGAQNQLAKTWAAVPEVIAQTEELIRLPATAEALRQAPAQERLRERLGTVMEAGGYKGFFVIGPGNVNLASSRNRNLGTVNLLAGNGDTLERLWSGEALVSPPQHSDVPLTDERGVIVEGLATMFSGAPIRDLEGKIIAVLTFRVDPEVTIGRFLDRGRFGESGETYVFDAAGVMLSESRFNDQLLRLGLIPEHKHSALHVEIRDPGANLAAGETPKLSREQWPLTRMAASATTGETGIDLDGYRDYRGTTVIGAWQWNPELGIGIATEEDADLAYAPLHRIQTLLVAFDAFTIVLLTGLAWVFERGRRRVAESEDRFRDFTDTASDWIWETDENLRFTYASDKYFEIGIKAREDVIGKTRFELVGEERIEASPEIWARHRRGLEAHRPFADFQYPMEGRDGAIHIVSINGKPVFDDDGAFRGYRGTGADITQRRKAEFELRRSEERLKSIITNSADGIVSIDDTGHIDTFNPAAEEMFGYGADEVVGRNVNILMQEDERAQHDKYIEQSDLRAPRIVNQTRPLFGRRKDGSLFPLELNVSKMDSAERTMYVGLLRDITERQRFEDNIQKANRNLATLSECNEVVARASDENALLNDICRIVVRTNDQAMAWVGYALDDAQKTVLPVAWQGFERGYLESLEVRWDDSEQGQGPIGTAIRTGEPYFIEDSQTDPRFAPWREYSARLGHRSILALPLKSGGKTFGGIAVYGSGAGTFTRDTIEMLQHLADNAAWGITALRGQQARRAAERDMKKARDEADRANQAKSQFLSSMSHELRTPMNAILGFGQMLQFNPKEPLTEAQKGCVDHILKGGAHLLELINEVLDLARIEAGRLDLSIENVSPGDVGRECLALIEPQAAKRGIAIRTPDKMMMRSVRADYTRFKQVLLNLLSNAVKYNKPGGEVRIWCEERASGMLRISVADTGPGLTAAQQDKLFEPFNRLGAEQTEVEGTGIGLTITKRLIEAMGGRIGIDSVLGEGSVFWFELPLADESRQSDAARLEAELKAGFLKAVAGRILYVEDNPANLQLMELIVERIDGLELISAHNAELGLERAHREKPDVIILDINLPGMDGYAALNKLKDDPKTQHIPVIALTANATRKDIERGIEAGFLEYLTKPVEIAKVTAAIDKAMRIARGG